MLFILVINSLPALPVSKLKALTFSLQLRIFASVPAKLNPLVKFYQTIIANLYTKQLIRTKLPMRKDVW